MGTTRSADEFNLMMNDEEITHVLKQSLERTVMNLTNQTYKPVLTPNNVTCTLKQTARALKATIKAYKIVEKSLVTLVGFE